MMPVIRISEQTWERLKKYAEPFVHSPEDVVNMGLDALEQSMEKNGHLAKPVNGTATKPRTVQRTEGDKLPQRAFRAPLLQTLMELGGSAGTAQIRERMEKKLASRLQEGDYAKVSSGELRWWNATCWERNDLVKEGLLKGNSPRGVWELSMKGSALVNSGEALAQSQTSAKK